MLGLRTPEGLHREDTEVVEALHNVADTSEEAFDVHTPMELLVEEAASAVLGAEEVGDTIQEAAMIMVESCSHLLKKKESRV
jgi:hypothetical protein